MYEKLNQWEKVGIVEGINVCFLLSLRKYSDILIDLQWKFEKFILIEKLGGR